MTIDLIEARVKELLAQKEQLLAEANAVAGEIRGCIYWANQLRAEAAKAQEPPPAKPE